MSDIRTALERHGWFQEEGAYVLIDGQYGSTGKGLVASMLAEAFLDTNVEVTTNAGPNSGHTFYHGDNKVVLRQIPSFAAYHWLSGINTLAFLNAGAIIDPEVLNSEIEMFKDHPNLYVHENAAIVTDSHREVESKLVVVIGSTGKGVGAALAAKIMRGPNVVRNHKDSLRCETYTKKYEDVKVLVETAQGFGLSLNASGFYPHTTSRDVTVAQALSDAGLHPRDLRQTMMVVRTFPIRVAGNSGGGYPGQEEITWEELGVEPEFTTVTLKKRRVFKWSREQFIHSLRAIQPDHLFVNFLQYIQGEDNQYRFVEQMIKDYHGTMWRYPRTVIAGYGPRIEDCKVLSM